MTIKRILIEIYRNQGYIWLLMALVFLLAELTTPGLFFFVAFAFGCVAGAMAAFLGASFAAQCIASLTVTVLSFWVLRHYFATVSEKDSVKTNFHALSSVDGLALTDIGAGYGGRARVGGEVWPAKTEGEMLQKGEQVHIVKVEGNHLIVQKK